MSRALRSRLRSAVNVVLNTGQTIGGMLWETDRRVMVLRDAKLLGVDPQGPLPVDGEVVIEWSQVSYVQRLP